MRMIMSRWVYACYMPCHVKPVFVECRIHTQRVASLFCDFFSNGTDIFEISCLRRLANLADA